MLARLFWPVFALIFGVNFIIIALAYTAGGMARGFGFVFIITSIIITLAAVMFYFSGSNIIRGASLVLVIVLGIPGVIALRAFGLQTYRARQAARGDLYLSGPALQLANALYDRDVASVKRLIPAAGNLNQPGPGGQTLLQFAVEHADDSDASVESIGALLTGGADPKTSANASLLTRAIDSGPRVTKLMLEAGANPNLLDGAKRPVWWWAITERYDQDLALLQLLLEHGADLHSRDRSGGPVSYAVREECWRAACLLIERGAGWKQEQCDGQPVRAAIADHIRNLQTLRRPVPDKLRKALAFYDSAAE